MDAMSDEEFMSGCMYDMFLMKNDLEKLKLKQKPIKTNADRIRAMTDERIAEIFAMSRGCPMWADENYTCTSRNGCEEDGKKCWLEWLRLTKLNASNTLSSEVTGNDS